MGELTRRRFVGATAGVAGAAALTSLLPAAAAAAAETAGAAGAAGSWAGERSSNGWPLLEAPESFGVEGSDQEVRLAGGDAAVVLLHVARRFHYEIGELRAGEIHGWTSGRRVAREYESNYLSGTAIAVRPLSYPAGARDGLYPNELVVVRDILAELDGVVVWGGDLTPVKESHFEIAVKPGHPRLKGVARKIEGWRKGPGDEGAGATDAFDPARREKARAFARRSA
ncbi:hypothetical protein L1I79_10865 [Strepomyces sp. STD 3.1]|uniref:hypothetical protein n=1 Tax=Streptomyces sp. NPDC058985 TaxID=3346684 RepID=UPI001F2D75B1|nr:hypothetical protein [Streptomyces sp. STD 3.1]